MKELTIRISLYDIEEVNSEDIINIHEYFDGYFPNNKGIGHTIKEVMDYKQAFEFLKSYIEDMDKENKPE